MGGGLLFYGVKRDYGVYISAKTVAKHNNLALKFIACKGKNKFKSSEI